MRWNQKHCAQPLIRLDPRQKVWIKAPDDVGHEGIVVEYDHNPNSVLMRPQGRALRRNRKHIFPLSPESNDHSDSVVLEEESEGEPVGDKDDTTEAIPFDMSPNPASPNASDQGILSELNTSASTALPYSEERPEAENIREGSNPIAHTQGEVQNLPVLQSGRPLKNTHRPEYFYPD